MKNALKFKWETEHQKSSAEKTFYKLKEKIYDRNGLKLSNDSRLALIDFKKIIIIIFIIKIFKLIL